MTRLLCAVLAIVMLSASGAAAQARTGPPCQRLARLRANLFDPPALRLRGVRHALPGGVPLSRRRAGPHGVHGARDVPGAGAEAGSDLRDARRGSELQRHVGRRPDALQRLRRLRARGLCGRQLSDDRLASVAGDCRDLDGRTDRDDDGAAAPSALWSCRGVQRGAADGYE